jgi:hypothetical protein
VSDPAADSPAPDSPEAGDTDTASLYGEPPQEGSDDSGSDAGSDADDDVPELGAEDDLAPGSTGALDEG